MKLSHNQRQLHQRATELAKAHRKIEAELVEVLQAIDKTKTFRALGYSSLFLYACGALGLTDAMAYAFIGVARKTASFPELASAIRLQKLSVGKASRIVAALTSENVGELVEFACEHSVRETDRKVAGIQPGLAKPERARPYTEDMVRLEVNISQQTLAKLKRVQSVCASAAGKLVETDEVLSAALDAYLDRHDPVRKAERAEARRKALVSKESQKTQDALGAQEQGKPVGEQEPRGEHDPHGEQVPRGQQGPHGEQVPHGQHDPHVEQVPRGQQGPRGEQVPHGERQPSTWHEELCAFRAEVTPTQPQSAAERSAVRAQTKHQVMVRDQGRCTHLDPHGRRCGNDRWTHLHHIQPVSQGGANSPENLTTLCAFHHDLVHQLTFSYFAGERSKKNTVLKSPSVRYRAF
jgi:hypothetical protein